MSYCTGADVKAIIDTELEADDPELENLIAESDQEIVDRGLTGRSALTLQYISKYLTAEQLAMKNPIPDKSISDSTGTHAPEYYRAMAERRIAETQMTPTTGGVVPGAVIDNAKFPWE